MFRRVPEAHVDHRSAGRDAREVRLDSGQLATGHQIMSTSSFPVTSNSRNRRGPHSTGCGSDSAVGSEMDPLAALGLIDSISTTPAVSAPLGTHARTHVPSIR